MPTPYPHILYIPTPDGQQVFVPLDIQPPDPPDPTVNAQAVLITSGLEYSFLPLSGIRLDPYVDPQGEFTQDCIVCTNPDLPGFRAYYRPDQDTSREEWVFEWGDPWHTVPTASMHEYSVTITRRDGSTTTVQAPDGHYWYARWRWQSTPRRVRRNHSQLAAANLIPYFDTTGLATGPILTVSDYYPMAYCGIPKDQGQTGGYPGLGITTGWLAQYLVRGAPETAWRNQAEASGTFQAHVRDTNTHAPIDIVSQYPTATMYSSGTGSPYISKGPNANRTDQGHMPSITYIPYQLTGDPYYLEELQFWANQNMLALPGNGSRFMVAGRYLAWPLRAIYECVLGTPDTVPSWLLPKSYWMHWLDVCRGFVESRMTNAVDPWFYVFHTIPDTGQDTDIDPVPSGDHVWQQNMLDLVAAWIASTRVDWVEPAEWLIHSSVARASETSGWCRSRPSPYHMRLQNVSVLREAMDTSSTEIRLQYPQFFTEGSQVKIDNETFTLLCQSEDGMDWTFQPRTNAAAHPAKREVWGNKCQSWAEAAELNVFTYDWTDTGDNSHLSPQTTDATYPSYQRAALAQALHAGLEVPGLHDAYDWLDAELRRIDLPIGDNWCVMPNQQAHMRLTWRRSDASDPQINITMRNLIDEMRGDEDA